MIFFELSPVTPCKEIHVYDYLIYYKFDKYSVYFCINSFKMKLLTNKEAVHMKNMTNQTVQTYKGVTSSYL